MSAVVVEHTSAKTLREGAFGNAKALSCRECGHRVELGPHYACPECFGPLEIAYEFPAVSRQEIEAARRRRRGLRWNAGHLDRLQAAGGGRRSMNAEPVRICPACPVPLERRPAASGSRPRQAR